MTETAGAGIEALASPSMRDRREVIRSLASLGRGGLSLLERATRDARPVIRCGALDALGALGLPEVVTIVRRVASREREAHVRWHAVLALPGVKHGVAIGEMLSLAKDGNAFPHRAVRQALAESLPQWLSPLKRATISSNVRVRRAAVWAVAEVAPKGAVDVLTRALRDEDHLVRGVAARGLILAGTNAATSVVVREAREGSWAAMRALAIARHEAAVPPLAQVARDRDSAAREDAVDYLGLSGSRRAVRVVVQALHDRCERVRWAAIEALGNLANSVALRPLLAIVRSTQSLKLRSSAAWALTRVAQCRGSQVRAAWESARDPVARLLLEAALCSIERRGEPRAAVESLRSGRSARLREAAAYALGLPGLRDAADPLVRAMRQDGSVRVRRMCAASLEHAGSHDHVALVLAAMADSWLRVEVHLLQFLRRHAEFDDVPIIERSLHGTSDPRLKWLLEGVLLDVELKARNPVRNSEQ